MKISYINKIKLEYDTLLKMNFNMPGLSIQVGTYGYSMYLHFILLKYDV